MPAFSWNGKVRQRAQHAIEQGEQQGQDLAALLPGAPDRGHHLRPAPPCLHHFGNNVGRVLQVAIHQYNRISAGGLQPAEIAPMCPSLRERSDHHHVISVDFQVHNNTR